MNVSRETAPAKINLALHIIGRRNDGYHLLESLVVFTRYGDQLTASSALKNNQGYKLETSGPFGDRLGQGSDNLVIKATTTLTERYRDVLAEMPGMELHLEKNLPVASGIGGGSADAAAALRLISRYFSEPLQTLQLMEVSKSLGADVPMCLLSRPLIAKGIGEVLNEIRLPSFAMVLVNPGVAVSTPEVFNRLGRSDNPALPDVSQIKCLDDLISYLGSTRNDLMTPAIQIAPVITEVIAALEQSKSCKFARMSGSGASCFGLYNSSVDAENAANDIRQHHPDWWCVATSTIPSS
jgi:4-diphosphocytidyl-2-C-methyl-D-erythritol kinase